MFMVTQREASTLVEGPEPELLMPPAQHPAPAISTDSFGLYERAHDIMTMTGAQQSSACQRNTRCFSPRFFVFVKILFLSNLYTQNGT